MVHQTSWNSLFDHLKFPKNVVNSRVGIFFVHNTFYHLFFRYRHYISFVSLHKSYQVAGAFLIANACSWSSLKYCFFGTSFIFQFYSQIVFAYLIVEYFIFFLWLLGKYFSARFTLQCNNFLERKTLSLPCVGVFLVTSRDEDEDDGCGVCGTEKNLSWFFYCWTDDFMFLWAVTLWRIFFLVK